MVYHELGWIRSGGGKMCPLLKRAALEWYRPLRFLPCFLQKPLKYIRQRLRKVPVIVQLDAACCGDFSFRKLAETAGCSVHRELPLINAFSAKVSARSLERLAKNVFVKKIWYDRCVRSVLDVASPVVQAPPLWQAEVTGRGVTVAVLDTGIYEHPDLSGRIVAFKDLVNNKTIPYDDNGHGTHVAGGIASSGVMSGSLYRAPAFEAGLVGVKVLDKEGKGKISSVIEGIQWCIENKDLYSIRVLNLSVGADATEPYTDDPVCLAVEKAWRDGIVICAAAGNEGPQSGTIGSPGIDPLIITVGALDDGNTVNGEDDQVAYFSSRGPTVDGQPKPDVIAPGVNIISLRSPGSHIDKKNKESRVNEWYTSLSGTSMAAPLCSGVVAQLLQHDASLTPDQVKERLLKTARKIDNLDEYVQGAGVIDAKAAVLYKA
ncbi:MAG TPA: S8 family peptidase [Bacillota bacterium]|nr:S8 family peptidase [Bacillota bacterium]